MMAPKHRNRRLLLVATIGMVLALGTGLLLTALRDSTQFFYNPSEVVATGFVPGSDEFRIGGLVNPESVEQIGELTIQFEIIDLIEDFDDVRREGPLVVAQYTGVVPDLFQEGKGVVVKGHLGDGVFLANEVLAKHDENYQPKKNNY